MILQLIPPLNVITPLGNGVAQFVLDYSEYSAVYFIVFLEKSGTCHKFKCKDICIETYKKDKLSAPFSWCQSSDYWQ